MNIMRNIAASAVLIPSVAFASSHREAPSIANDPAADNTDLYAWVTPTTHADVNIVANWIPLEEPSGGPNFHKFSDDVLYEIHITRGDSLADVVKYQFEFTTAASPVVTVSGDAGVGGGQEFFSQISGSGLAPPAQTMKVSKVVGTVVTVLASGVPVAPPNIGPRTDAVAYKLAADAGPTGNASYDDAFAATFIRSLSGGGSVWAGPRDDGFYVDLGAVFDLANLRIGAGGVGLSGFADGPGLDGVAGYNTHSIAITIPTTSVPGVQTGSSGIDSVIGVWASSSRKKITVLKNNGTKETSGPWVQVSRLGLPLINEAVIGVQDKDKYNATQPPTDLANFGAYFLNPVVVKDAEAVGIYAALGADPAPFKSGRLDIVNAISLNNGSHTFNVVGDVLKVDVAVDSAFPNGRTLSGPNPDEEGTDVTDLLLSLLLTGALTGVTDDAQHNDKDFLPTMPWLPLPHQGFAEGHGIPTP